MTMSDSDNDSYILIDSPCVHHEQQTYVSAAVKQRSTVVLKKKSRLLDCRASTWETDDSNDENDGAWSYDESDKRDETICARPQKHYKHRFNRVKHVKHIQTSYMSTSKVKHLQKKKKAKQCTKERTRMRDAKQFDQTDRTEPVSDTETIIHRIECVGYVRAFNTYTPCNEKKRNDMIDMIESKPNKWFKQRMNRPRRYDHKLMRRNQHDNEKYKRRLAAKKKTISRAFDRRIKCETDMVLTQNNEGEYADIIFGRGRCDWHSCFRRFWGMSGGGGGGSLTSYHSEYLTKLLVYDTLEQQQHASKEMMMCMHQVLSSYAKTNTLQKEVVDVFARIHSLENMDWIHLYFFFMLISNLTLKRYIFTRCHSHQRFLNFLSWLQPFLLDHLTTDTMASSEMVHIIRMQWLHTPILATTATPTTPLPQSSTK